LGTQLQRPPICPSRPISLSFQNARAMTLAGHSRLSQNDDSSRSAKFSPLSPPKHRRNDLCRSCAGERMSHRPPALGQAGVLGRSGLTQNLRTESLVLSRRAVRFLTLTSEGHKAESSPDLRQSRLSSVQLTRPLQCCQLAPDTTRVCSSPIITSHS